MVIGPGVEEKKEILGFLYKSVRKHRFLAWGFK